MAPSTPPPPSKEVLAALTMASTSSVVMSATQISSRQQPSCTVRIVCGSLGIVAPRRVFALRREYHIYAGVLPQTPIRSLLSPFGPGIRLQIEGAALSDI